MLNRHTCSHLNKVFLTVTHSRVKGICSTSKECRQYSQDLIKRFVEQGYNESTVRKQIQRVDHSNHVIYVSECAMCKIQYVGKSETVNIRLNTYWKDIKKTNTIEVCKHFNSNKHIFINMANL